jgi:hypothetical protein
MIAQSINRPRTQREINRENLFFTLGLIIFFFIVVLVNLSFIKPAFVLSNAKVIEYKRMQQRGLSHPSIQEQAINKNIDNCLNGYDDERSRYTTLGSQTEKVTYWFKDTSQNELNNVVNQSEEECTSKLLDNVAIHGEQEAEALAYILLKNHYPVDDKYKNKAKQDNVAFANLHF